ncbi:hypothetical protein QUF80_21855 [Desulfococcaceae bacterium HSG8]|nr:hypothetical protein [Desulfococcaceae bacterium HSG8]
MRRIISQNTGLCLFVAIIFFWSAAGSAQQNATTPDQPSESPAAPKESDTEAPPDEQKGDKKEVIEMTDIHDIKPPEKIGTDWKPLYYTLLAVLILLLVGAVLLYLKKRRKRIRKKEMISLSPDEAAFVLLDELLDVESFDGKKFYFRLSSILRNYIQGRYGINAPEMTTEEFLPSIEKLNLDRELQQHLRKLIHSTDPVKFAGTPAVQTNMEKDLAFVRAFVKQTTPETT